MPTSQSTTHRSTPKNHEPRFGFRIPRDGTPAPFRVLISLRWLWAMLSGGLLTLLGTLKGPVHLRRWFLPVSGVLGCTLLVAAVAGARRLVFERITLPITNLPPALNGVRIAHLSDLHLGSPFTIVNTQRAVAWVQEQKPDLVVFTGDFVSFTNKIPLLRDCLSGISAPHGVYAILGNHDYWTHVPALERSLEQLGIVLLRNEARHLQIGDAALHLVGIDCVWEARHDVKTALKELPTDGPVIVLAHEPDIADDVAAYPVDVQLSGHTHAGHVALPGLGPFFLPRHGFRYYRGLQRVGGMWLYVSRGLGGIPVRLGSPPEVTEITLRAA